MPSIHEPIYSAPRLTDGHVILTADTEHAKKERKRRKVERTLLEKLSRYYPVPQNKKTWERGPLLWKGEHMHDHSTC